MIAADILLLLGDILVLPAVAPVLEAALGVVARVNISRTGIGRRLENACTLCLECSWQDCCVMTASA